MVLRNYQTGTPQHKFYTEQHKTQTYEYVKQKLAEFDIRPKVRMTMSSVLAKMDDFIDPSDPDTDNENSIHAYQTAERIRKEHPENKELQVCGLIHDLGKILFSFGEPSIAVVGDTYVVGCEFPKSIVYYETMQENPDSKHPIYSTRNGIYEERCGLENLTITFGHDEYLYQVLQQCPNYPIRYKNIIRYHSLYPLHMGGDYQHFLNDTDEKIIQDVRFFNQYDLYSKADTEFQLTDEIRKYYDELLTELFNEPLDW